MSCGRKLLMEQKRLRTLVSSLKYYDDLRCIIISYCDYDINDVDNHNDDGNDLIIFPGVPRRASEHEDLDLAGQKHQQFYIHHFSC